MCVRMVNRKRVAAVTGVRMGYLVPVGRFTIVYYGAWNTVSLSLFDVLGGGIGYTWTHISMNYHTLDAIPESSRID